MKYRNYLLKISFLFLLCFIGCAENYAQADAMNQRPTAQKEEEFPEGFREGIAKRRIKAEEKEYEELLQRGEEAVKISDELAKNYEVNKSLTAEDTKKIEQLEKVIKKIRQDLGAKDEGIDATEKDDTPSSIEKILGNIKETTTDLLSALKKTSRHSISVIAIQSSNSLLKLVRFARFNRN